MCAAGQMWSWSSGCVFKRPPAFYYISPFMLAINFAATGTIHTHKVGGSDRSSCCFKWLYSIPKTANSAATTSVTCIHQIHQKIDYPLLDILFSSGYITARQIHQAGRKKMQVRQSYGKKESRGGREGEGGPLHKNWCWGCQSLWNKLLGLEAFLGE